MFIQETAAEQLVLGLWFLFCGLVLGPLMVRLMLRWTAWMNGRVGGFAERSYLFVEPGFKVFFAIVLGLIAIVGTAHLLVYALAKAGLIQSPWQ